MYSHIISLYSHLISLYSHLISLYSHILQGTTLLNGSTLLTGGFRGSPVEPSRQIQGGHGRVLRNFLSRFGLFRGVQGCHSPRTKHGRVGGGGAVHRTGVGRSRTLSLQKVFYRVVQLPMIRLRMIPKDTTLHTRYSVFSFKRVLDDRQYGTHIYIVSTRVVVTYTNQIAGPYKL